MSNWYYMTTIVGNNIYQDQMRVHETLEQALACVSTMSRPAKLYSYGYPPGDDLFEKYYGGPIIFKVYPSSKPDKLDYRWIWNSYSSTWELVS